MSYALETKRARGEVIAPKQKKKETGVGAEVGNINFFHLAVAPITADCAPIT
jgi:hypothetical protein